jgi:peptide-methionine (R)-S-oxide reductase
MFSDTNNDTHSSKTTRRAFLASAMAIAAGLYWWSMKKSNAAEASHAVRPAGPPEEVTIVEFTDAGERKATVHVPKIVKSDAEWRQKLDSNAFDITRHEDTEMAFSGKLWNEHGTGIYRCICCDTALFSSATKFESGTGWPSFWQPIAEENVASIQDRSFGMTRTAVECRRCDAHLGHVFEDGPKPTGLRYCMNSASLRFVKSA